MIAAGTAQAWPGPASVLVTEIIPTPRQTILHVWLAAGNVREIAAMAPHVRDWAKANGCTRIQISGRKGWARARFLRDMGFVARDWVLLDLPLSP